ncbi:hypothetical protein BD410DRAFT_810537 [Rickenella mellea]|uniref:Uncharacterized protein n=1 Tax=Rickenella mellea TaxID=50990 RepID=A0A4Y7PGH2_9AGAM|nr:hypothetical protein BD410DRAFT_810537 [Rickenella mellea]
MSEQKRLLCAVFEKFVLDVRQEFCENGCMKNTGAVFWWGGGGGGAGGRNAGAGGRCDHGCDTYTAQNGNGWRNQMLAHECRIAVWRQQRQNPIPLAAAAPPVLQG